MGSIASKASNKGHLNDSKLEANPEPEPSVLTTRFLYAPAGCPAGPLTIESHAHGEKLITS